MTKKQLKMHKDSIFAAPTFSKGEKKEFYSAISHIFRGPLVGATGYVDYLFKGYAGALNSEQMKQLARVRQSILQLNNVIDAFLDIIAFDLGLINTGKEDNDINSKTEEICGNLRELVSKKKIGIKLKKAAAPLVVNMDYHWIKTILYELVSSSVLFTDKQNEIRVALSKNKHNARLEFAYSYPIADLENKNDIFKPLFRLGGKNYVQEGKRGGLGLSLVKKIVVAHKGSIRAVSLPNGAIKIFINLPLKRVL